MSIACAAAASAVYAIPNLSAADDPLFPLSLALVAGLGFAVGAVAALVRYAPRHWTTAGVAAAGIAGGLVTLAFGGVVYGSLLWPVPVASAGAALSSSLCFRSHADDELSHAR